MADLKRLWERTPDPWQPAMLDAADTAALRTAAERTVEAETFGEVRTGVRVRSRRIGRRSFFEWLARVPRDRTQYLLIYERHLVIINREGNKAPYAFAAKLEDLEVRSYTSTEIEDHGVRIRGFIGSGTKRGELFLGLGEGAAAVEFENTLREVTSPL